MNSSNFGLRKDLTPSIINIIYFISYIFFYFTKFLLNLVLIWIIMEYTVE
jgi:hypothetical protein